MAFGLQPCPAPPHLDLLLDAYPSSKKNVPDLYTTAWTDIPSRVLARDPPYLLQSELSTILDFKLTFGQNRPTLRGMINALSDTDVRKASENAFKLLSEAESTPEPDATILKAMKALTVLRGVGPATASLVLSLLSPSTPFFSDEAAVVILRPEAGRKGLKYTEGEYKRFLELVRQEAGNRGRRDWERRIWVEERAREIGLELKEGTNETFVGGKRKASPRGAEKEHIKDRRRKAAKSDEEEEAIARPARRKTKPRA